MFYIYFTSINPFHPSMPASHGGYFIFFIYIFLKSDFSSFVHLTFRYATCQYSLIFYMSLFFCCCLCLLFPGVGDERRKIAPRMEQSDLDWAFSAINKVYKLSQWSETWRLIILRSSEARTRFIESTTIPRLEIFNKVISFCYILDI